MSQKLSPLVSTSELSKIANTDGTVIIDGSWWLSGRDAIADYYQAHIPGAVFIDIDSVSDKASALPHTLPSSKQFAEVMSALGISDQDRIIVYDTQGLFSAARIWWLLKIFGASKAQVLDGGLPKWLAEKRETESGPAHPRVSAQFSARLNEGAVADIHDVMAALNSETQILDARGAARFNATAPEPRPGMRGGHMPGAHNLAYGQLLKADGTIKGGSELEAAFKDAGIDLDRPVITSCGSGVTAAILTLGLELLGKPSRLYDGSWSEWGSREDTPIET